MTLGGGAGVGYVEMGDSCGDFWYGWVLGDGLTNINPIMGGDGDLLLGSEEGVVYYYNNSLYFPTGCPGRTLALRISTGVPSEILSNVVSYSEGLGYNNHQSLNYGAELSNTAALVLGALAFQHSPSYLRWDVTIPEELHVHGWDNVYRLINTEGDAYGWTPNLDDADLLEGPPVDPATPIQSGLLVTHSTSSQGFFRVSFSNSGPVGPLAPEGLFLSAGVFQGVWTPAEIEAVGI